MKGKMWICSKLVSLLLIVTVCLHPLAAFAQSSSGEETLRSEISNLLFEGSQLVLDQRFDDALTKFEAALQISQKINDPQYEATCFLWIGDVKLNLSDYDGARDAFNASLPILQASKDREGEGQAIYSIGLIHQIRGEYQQALDMYNESLAIVETIPLPKGQIVLLNNIGIIYDDLGDYQTALQFFQHATDLAHNTLSNNVQETTIQIAQIRSAEASTLSRMGYLYFTLGQYEQALQQYDKALSIIQGIKYHANSYQAEIGLLLTEKGLVYLQLKDYKEALKYFEQALPLADIKENLGTTLDNIAYVYFSLGETALAQKQFTVANNFFKKALDNYRRALVIEQQTGDIRGRARTLVHIGMLYERRGESNRVLDLYQEALKLAESIEQKFPQAWILDNIALHYELHGNASQAIAYYQRSIELFESLQGSIKVEKLKASFIGEHIDAYAHLVKLLWTAGEKEQVFDYVQRAKARSYLDQIGNHQIDFRKGAAARLIEQEQLLRQQITGFESAIRTELLKPSENEDQDLIKILRAALESARGQHEQLIVQLQIENPEYASIVSISTVRLTELQRLLSNIDMAIIEYFVTEEYTLACVISGEDFQVVKLDISSNALTDRSIYLRNIIMDSDSEFDNSAAIELYQTLFSPLKQYIYNANLLIVPHNVLHYLPFAALQNAKTSHYLIQDYTITYAPSSSVLKFILDKRNSNQNRLLALGDPDNSLPRADNEVQTVGQLFNSQPLLGEQATESQVWMQASQIDILHLAAHGVYDPYNPLYTRIELATDSSNDGNLEVHEVYGLNLISVNLVVLSACDTALGQQSKGDELVGLTRAFIYAGAPSVITTLWSIDDEASGALMLSFYQHWNEGMTVAEALRQAQIEALSRHEKNAPYYWAAFELTGDYHGNDRQ